MHHRLPADEATSMQVNGLLRTLIEVFETMRQCEPDGFVACTLKSASLNEVCDPHAHQPWAPCGPHTHQPWAPCDPHTHQPWAPCDPRAHQPWAPCDPHAHHPWAPCDPHAHQPWAPCDPHAHQPWAPCDCCPVGQAQRDASLLPAAHLGTPRPCGHSRHGVGPAQACGAYRRA